MITVDHKTKSGYAVIPRTWHKKGAPKSIPTLQALRKAVSKAWHGMGAVEEIRTQRRRNAL